MLFNKKFFDSFLTLGYLKSVVFQNFLKILVNSNNYLFIAFTSWICNFFCIGPKNLYFRDQWSDFKREINSKVQQYYFIINCYFYRCGRIFEKIMKIKFQWIFFSDICKNNYSFYSSMNILKRWLELNISSK